MTYYELLKYGECSLQNAGTEDAEFDALHLILKASDKNNTSFWLSKNDIADESIIRQYKSYISRRSKGEPLQYIIGSWAFYKNEFEVGNGVLIPRPETEELVDICVTIIKNKDIKIVYDLCTGTGCIGLSIAKEFPDVTVFLFELYDEAIYYAKKNIENLGVKNAVLIKCDILREIPDNIALPDMIVSNPPYIESSEISLLQYEVLQEPHSALDGGVSGFDFYDAIFDEWMKKTDKGTVIALECGEGQAEVLQKKYNNEFNIKIRKDIFGTDRFIIGDKK